MKQISPLKKKRKKGKGNGRRELLLGNGDIWECEKCIAVQAEGQKVHDSTDGRNTKIYGDVDKWDILLLTEERD